MRILKRSKKKLAALLAFVMLFSLVPVMTISADNQSAFSVTATAPREVYTGTGTSGINANLFAVVVKTGLDATDVRLVNTATDTPLTVANANKHRSDLGAVSTWVLRIQLATAGEYSFAVEQQVDGAWASSGVTLPITATTIPASQSRTMPTRATTHDPSVFRDPNATTPTWYVFGSNRTVARSTNLISWTGATAVNYGSGNNNLLPSFAWAGRDGTNGSGSGAIWAPDAIWNPHYLNADGTSGAYMIYYPVSSNFRRGAVGFAVNKDSITGEFTYGGTVQYSGFTLRGGPDEVRATVDTIWTNTNIDELIDAGIIKPHPGDATMVGQYPVPTGVNPKWFMEDGSYNTVNFSESIDPSVFFCKEGKMWLIYGAKNGGIFLLEIEPTTGIPKYPGVDGWTDGTADGSLGGNEIDRYFGTRIAGNFFKAGEGAYIIYDPVSDYYFLYHTLGNINEGYNIRQFRSRSVQGPYVDASGKNAAWFDNSGSSDDAGIKLIANYALTNITWGSGQWARVHAGHGSVLIEDGQMYKIFHQKFRTNNSLSTGNQVRIHQMFRNEDNWPVVAVFENAGSVISPTGYALSDIVGTYEFINHGRQTTAALVDTLVVNLNADGTVTGDVEGTWSTTPDTYYMSMTINGVVYKGVFFKQQDELNVVSQSMTFTASGSNNESIWGAKMESDFRTVTASSAAINIPYNNLTNNNDNPDRARPATSDFALFTQGKYGTDIIWTSSHPAIISTDGKVTRPATATNVTLTAIIIKDKAVLTRAFTVRVEPTGERFTLTPIYEYDFSVTDGYLARNTGRVTSAGTMAGNTRPVSDVIKGPAIEMTGTSSYLKLPANSLACLPTGFSVSMWVNPSTGYNGTLFNISKGGSSLFSIPASLVPAGQWSFVSLTVGQAGSALYVDGSRVSASSEDLSALFSGGLTNLDIRAGGGEGTLRIDDVKVYEIAFTDSQIAGLLDPDVSWQTSWWIDFQPEGAPRWGSFTIMTNYTVYNKTLPVLQSFGFTEEIYSHETAEGGNKFRDFVYMPGGMPYTFNMDLPNGTYNVYVYTGAKDSANVTHFTIQDDPRVYRHETPSDVGSDNHPPMAPYRNFTVYVIDNLLTMTFWGDNTQGPDFMTGRLGSLEITRLGSLPEEFRTITFDATGGTVSPATMLTNIEGMLKSLPTPVRVDYLFDGWFTEAEGGELITTETVFEENATVFAQWTFNGVLPVSSLRIADEAGVQAAPMILMPRNSEKKFTADINLGAAAAGIIWSVNNPNLATVTVVDGIATVITKGMSGNATLTARDPETGISHSIVLRIM